MAERHHRGPNYEDKRKNNIFERVKKNHADLAWNYPAAKVERTHEAKEER